MQLIYKSEVLFATSDPEEILNWLAEELHVDVPTLPTTIAIDCLLQKNSDYSVPFLDFFNFLEYHKALEAFLKATEDQNKDFGFTASDLLSEVIDKRYYPCSCFNWTTSPEGSEYWDYIDNLWVLESNATRQ